jgi:hypothetical protein
MTAGFKPNLPTDGARADSLDRLVLRWPKRIRREIEEWLGGAIIGHGSPLSKPAYRRWRYMCDKLKAQNDQAQRSALKNL